MSALVQNYKFNEQRLICKTIYSGMSFPSKSIVSQGLHSHNNDANDEGLHSHNNNANDDVSVTNSSHCQNSLKNKLNKFVTKSSTSLINKVPISQLMLKTGHLIPLLTSEYYYDKSCMTIQGTSCSNAKSQIGKYYDNTTCGLMMIH